MTPELKQRLVGAAVLLFLAGLLWALLFDFDAPERELTSLVLVPPAMPVIEEVIVEPATPFYDGTSTDSVSAISISTLPEQASGSTELSNLLGEAPAPKTIADKNHSVDQKDRPRLDAQGIPIAFVVQLGSFNRFDNADKFRNQLVNDYHFKAYLEPKVEMGDGPYKVLVGPALTYSDVSKLADDLKKITEVKDVIIKRFGDT